MLVTKSRTLIILSPYGVSPFFLIDKFYKAYSQYIKLSNEEKKMIFQNIIDEYVTTFGKALSSQRPN
jgi:hypothetical protein